MRHVVVALLLCVSTCVSAWNNMVTPLVCLDDYCDLVFPAMDYSPFVGYSFYVRVRLFLNISSSPASPEDQEEGVVALTLTGAELSKEHGAAPGPGALPLGAFAIFLLKSATTFAASVSYGKGAVVGRAKGDCPHNNNNRTLSCLEEVEIRQDLFESDTSKFTAYDARYWRRLVARHVRDFGATDLRVALQLQKDDKLDAHYYVNPLLQGAPLTELSLRDVADIGAVDLGPQEALVNLTVTGVQVKNYTGLLSGAPHLRSLTLSHVDLTTLEPLSGLEQLETLDVSGNPSLDLSTLLLPASLTSLSVSDCPRAVTSLPPLLRRLPRLRRLDAAGCSLKTLETFSPFPSLLEHLDLSRNQLTSVPDDAFSSLAALRTLNLSGNSLTSVSLQLDTAATLTVLDLADNLLESPAHLLRAGKVATLNLSGNPIVEWDDADAFSPWLAGGGVLDLSRCRVAFLTAPMRASLSRAAQSRAVVLLDANPLDCEHCRVAELKEWLTAPEGVPLAPSLRCAKPPALEGQLVATAPGEGVCPSEAGGPNLYAVLLPLGAVMLALGAAAGGAGYVYRYEITYIKHLVKLRRGRRGNNSGGGGGVFQYDAFVCYSGNDRNWVMRKLLPELEHGPGRYRLCLHERDFILGSIIARNIVSFMQESRNTIVVLTESFVKSQWCQWELDMANHKVFADDRDFLIFVELERLERRTLPRHLRYLMDTRTYLEWPASGDVDVPDEEALWRRLRTAMGPSIAASARNSPVTTNTVATTVDTVTTSNTASSA